MASRKKSGKGIFITLEGSDGSGKSTQITTLEERLNKMGVAVLSTREPGGTDQAEKIRNFILSGKAEEFGSEFEATLFTAARLDHAEQLIAPAIEDGKVVLCDRFIDSTRVYQGSVGKVKLDFLHTLETLVRDIAWPNLTIVLDLDPEEGNQRANSRRQANTSPDRFEKESLAIQQERRAAFLSIAKAEPRRCKVVDASGEVEEVAERIWKLVGPLLKTKLGVVSA